MINVILDGKGMEIEEGSRLKDIIPDLPSEFSVAIIRPSESSEISTKNFRIISDEGEVVIELEEESGGFAVQALLDTILKKKELLPLQLKWEDRYSSAFGPFSSKIKPDKKIHRYSKGDIILGCGGYDPDNSYLIFSRIDHMADHGSDESGGVLGRIVSGIGVINRWGVNSRITDTERIISKVETGNSFTTKDRDMTLEDGMEIVTHVKVSAYGYNEASIDPSGCVSVEHMLLALSDERFVTTQRSSTFLSDDRLKNSIVPYEIKNPRLEGSVTVRTKGKQMGSVYIYLTDIPSSPSHTTTGQVRHGIELVKLASDEDILNIKAYPPQIDLRGMSLRDAIQVAEERGIKTQHDSDETEGRIVVQQTPATTMEILSEGSVSLETVDAGKVLNIRLDDSNAPRTCKIFREITGLRWYKIGSLPLIFKYDDVALFKPKIPKNVTINLENLPEGEVPADALAITNDSRKGKGLIGIRKNPNKEFGPTSEPFEGTNILGTVIDSDKLDSLKENDTVYIMEVP